MNAKDLVSQGLLKVHFVIKAWQDTQKKLQKVGGCSEQSLWGALLREALEVYIGWGDEKEKQSAKLMVLTVEGWRKRKKIFRGSQGQDGKEKKRDEGMAGKESSGTGFEAWPGWPLQIAISGVEEGGEKENGKVQAGER